jgi:hypothetical protein
MNYVFLVATYLRRCGHSIEIYMVDASGLSIENTTYIVKIDQKK